MAPGMMIIDNNSNMSHWTLDGGYDESLSNEEYPLRVAGSGRNAELTLGLVLNGRDFEFMCKGFDQGFLVSLTMPGETQKMSSNSLRVPPIENTFISIQPKITITSEGLLNYSPSQRFCFFTRERQLRFFKMYTQLNCETEYLANFTKLECECVRFSMPSKTFFFISNKKKY